MEYIPIKSLKKFLKESKKKNFLPKIKLSYEATAMGKKQLIDSQTSAKYIRNLFDMDTFQIREESLVILTTAKKNPIGCFSLGKGNKYGVMADFSYLFQMCFQYSADGFIIAHNHPLDNSIPSKSDFSFTWKLKEKCEILDLELVDHIILGSDNEDYFSFSDHVLE